jgi:ABC-type Na+ efflux pump permease subunit
MNNLKSFFIAAALFTAVQASAQTDKETTIRLVEAKNLVFSATTAYPLAGADINAILSKMPGGQSGSAIQLDGSRYQLKIEKESIDSDLPYYGRAYNASRNPDDAGIKFKSKDFSYVAEKKKKGNYVITIKPKDAREIQSMTLNVTLNGYATLSVNSTNRQPITFYGYIAESPTQGELSK